MYNPFMHLIRTENTDYKDNAMINSDALPFQFPKNSIFMNWRPEWWLHNSIYSNRGKRQCKISYRQDSISYPKIRCRRYSIWNNLETKKHKL